MRRLCIHVYVGNWFRAALFSHVSLQDGAAAAAAAINPILVETGHNSQTQ